MKNLVLLFIVFCLFVLCSLSFVSPVFASYVLPYPSYMPGNKLYRISRLIDTVKNYWYFGNIAQLKYHMGLADKYLIEAKTLFEYQQYLLAVDALTRSGEQLKVIPVNYYRAIGQGKDIQQLKKAINEEIDVHNDLLNKLKNDLPSSFAWQPEREKTTELRLHELLDRAIQDRLNIKQSLLKKP